MQELRNKKGERYKTACWLNLSLLVTKGKEMKTLQLKGRDWQKWIINHDPTLRCLQDLTSKCKISVH